MIQLPDYKPFPVFQVNTNFAQVVPKMNLKGRDLLQVKICFNLRFSYSVVSFWKLEIAYVQPLTTYFCRRCHVALLFFRFTSKFKKHIE